MKIIRNEAKNSDDFPGLINGISLYLTKVIVKEDIITVTIAKKT